MVLSAVLAAAWIINRSSISRTDNLMQRVMLSEEPRAPSRYVTKKYFYGSGYNGSLAGCFAAF